MLLFLRSLTFHTVFYLWTIFCAVALSWTFFIPRRQMVRVIRVYFASLRFLERSILGLNYQVIGRENLPDGPCLLAMKHQSTYETFKLYEIFGDVAIILKRELMWIPIWGWYQAKAGMIAIDRGAGVQAMRSIVNGAKKALHEQRSIVIFPQGTRTPPGVKKPYKSGIAILYEQLSLPVVPVALNAGCFWPRKAFLIKSGTVTFEILPALLPGLDRQVMMQQLEQNLEAHAQTLVVQAKQRS